jgi:predicted dehydrogenase
MLRLGIIGCGRVTSLFHMKAIEQIDEISVTALSDLNEERINNIKVSCGATGAYLDYKELLSDPNVEAVAVNTPPMSHEVIVLDALKSGKHVLCEKPLAENIGGCYKIKDAQIKTGLTVLPAHNYTFTPSLLEMINQIRNGSIGTITSLEVVFENLLKSYRSKSDFRETREKGILEDVFPHLLSVVKPLVGNIEKVSSVKWWCKEYDVCDNMSMELISKTMVPVSTSMSWTKLRPRFSILLRGSRGSMSTDLMMRPYQLDILIDGRTTTWKEKGIKWYLDLIQFKHPSFRNQYKHFYQLVKKNRSPMITIDDEIDIIKAMEQVSNKMRK